MVAGEPEPGYLFRVWDVEDGMPESTLAPGLLVLEVGRFTPIASPLLQSENVLSARTIAAHDEASRDA